MVCLECEKRAEVSLVKESKLKHCSRTNLQSTKIKRLVLIGDFEWLLIIGGDHEVS